MISLYSFIQTLDYEDIPASTRERVEASLLDIIGILAATRDNLLARNIRQYALDHYPAGQLAARLPFHGGQVHPLGAAWAAGFAADSLDGHEGHFTSKGHAGATVVPALITLIDATRNRGNAISGKEFLTLLAIAYETSLRSGKALMATASDYHASGAFSGFGVVCAGARLLQLDETQTAHALGIAEYFSARCPMMRVVDYPSNLRDAHGAGAYAGINALLMAQSGITGTPALLTDTTEMADIWSSLGLGWEIDEQYYKPWPVCRWAQPALTAIQGLLQKHAISADAIRQVKVETFHESMRLQGYHPQNPDEAQYGLAFPIAAMLCRGKVGPQEVTGDSLFSEDILAMADRVLIEEASDLSERFPEEILSRVAIQLTSGDIITSDTTQALGDPFTPMSSRQLLDKYFDFATVGLAQERALAISDTVRNLVTAPHCATLFDQILTS